MATYDLSRPRSRPLLVGAAVLATGALLVTLVATDDGSEEGTDLGPTAPAAARDLATTLSEAGTLQRSSELTVAYAGALTSGGEAVVPQGDDRSSSDGTDGDGGEGDSPTSYFTDGGGGGDTDDDGHDAADASTPGSSSTSSSTSTTACPTGGTSSTSSSTSSTNPSTPCSSSTTSSSTSTSSSTTSITAPRPTTTATTAAPPASGGDGGEGGRGDQPGGEQSPETGGDGGAGSDPRQPSPSGGAGTSPSGSGGDGSTGGNGGDGGGGEVPSATLTGVLDVGTRADRGSVLFTADDEPVVALIGELPAWRTLAEGVDDGADVRQLEENLVALGYGAGVVVDESFTAETAAAVEAWETALSRATPDGTVTIGDVVFLGSPGDVLGHDAEVGDTLQPGTPVLRLGSEQRMVVADVDATESGGWTAGSTVELEWADTTTSTGTVFATGRDVNDDGDVELLVAVGTGSDGAGERRSGAEAIVTLVNARRDGVVAVPVAAIVDHDGSPAVRIASDGATDEIVPVETGLVADGWVEITSGLTGDERVRLPA